MKSALQRGDKWAGAMIYIAGSVVLALGVSSMVGHIIQWARLYQWFKEDIGMAFNSAIAFIFTGSSLIVIGLIVKGDHAKPGAH